MTATTNIPVIDEISRRALKSITLNKGMMAPAIKTIIWDTLNLNSFWRALKLCHLISPSNRGFTWLRYAFETDQPSIFLLVSNFNLVLDLVICLINRSCVNSYHEAPERLSLLIRYFA